MPDTKTLLRETRDRIAPPQDVMGSLERRRERKDRNQRVAAGVLGIAVFALAAIGFVRLLGSGSTPASDPRSPFEGTWISTTDADGGTQTMTVRVSADSSVEITVLEDVATVCSGTPSTMTGTGRIEGGTQLVIPAAVYTCDDGSEPEALSGPPLQEQLHDLTFVLDAQTETLTDSFGVVWLREGAVDPSPEPTTSGQMWPQSSLEEVREAQKLADAGDPDYTWQVDPVLANSIWPSDDTEIVARFLREELGWEEFRYRVLPEDSFGSGGVYNNTFIRCASGETNPLYPNDPTGSGCAPTIDEVRYERVSLDLEQLVRQDPSGIWVVTHWAMIEPLEMVVPPSEAETAALLESFLQARIDGEGAEEYVDVLYQEPLPGEVPLLYATTTGAPYERFEFEVVEGPVWLDGWMRIEVRLFADGGATAVEQLFLVDRDATGRLRLQYEYSPEFAPTTENGQAVPVPYRLIDGEVTFRAAWPWLAWADEPQGPSIITLNTYSFGDLDDARLTVVADPRPVEGGCQEGPAPANAEALARSIRSDPDLEATAPATVSVGGIEALRMDVSAAPGASICKTYSQSMVVTGVLVGEWHPRMRLYLLDLPGGSSRILAIAITAPEPSFEQVMEDGAAPILDSFEFQAA